MADHSIGAWDELHESEASQASVFCFDNVFLQKSCLFIDLVCFFSLRLRVAAFLNATRSDRSVHGLPLREKVDQYNSLRRKEFTITVGTIEVCSLHFKLEDLGKFVEMTSLCGVWWCSSTSCIASTFPKSSTSKTSSVSKEVVHVRLCPRPIHSHGIARSNTNQVNEIQLPP